MWLEIVVTSLVVLAAALYLGRAVWRWFRSVVTGGRGRPQGITIEGRPNARP